MNKRKDKRIWAERMEKIRNDPIKLRNYLEKRRKRQKRWGEKNPQKVAEKNKMFKKKHPEYHNDWRRRHPEKIKQYDRYQYTKNPEKQWIKGTLHRHKHNGFNVILTKEELLNIIKNHKSCQICDRPLDFSNGNKGKQKDDSPSLDRKNNEQEIRKDNVLILCYKCNAMKNSATLDEYYIHCKKFISKYENKELYIEIGDALTPFIPKEGEAIKVTGQVGAHGIPGSLCTGIWEN